MFKSQPLSDKRLRRIHLRIALWLAPIVALLSRCIRHPQKNDPRMRAARQRLRAVEREVILVCVERALARVGAARLHAPPAHHRYNTQAGARWRATRSNSLRVLVGRLFADRRRLSRDLAPRLAMLQDFIRDADRTVARLVKRFRRGLTKIVRLTMTHPPARAFATDAPCAVAAHADTS